MSEITFPFRGSFPTTQDFANQLDMEPLGYMASDGSINYAGDGKPGHWHNGIDFGLPCNTPLYAACDGQVIAAGMSSSGFGNRVMIRDSRGLVVLCGHMATMSVATGQTVRQGDPIGLSGTTGNSDGCHLHVSVIRGAGSYINPLPLLSLDVPPTPRPADASHITYLQQPFSVKTQAPGGTRVWDGPSEQLHQLDHLEPGTVFQCNAWMMGAPKWDDSADQWDRRWYHKTSGGWVASARVIGNAPNSKP